MNRFKCYFILYALKAICNAVKSFGFITLSSHTFYDCGKMSLYQSVQHHTGLTHYFYFLTSRHSGAQSWAPECLDVKKLKWWVRLVWCWTLWSVTIWRQWTLKGLIYNSATVCWCVGIQCAGPCSIESICHGEIFQRHDTRLLFYDINTDVIHWTLQLNGQWRTTIEKNRSNASLLAEFRRHL